jgi:HAD superfamily hydrolase (TIGR01509 family)
MIKIKGIFFDQDGVIIDTERDGHRVSFNNTFRAFGFPFEWDVEEYKELLQIAGGKERMRHYFLQKGLDKTLDSSQLDDLIQRMHEYKTGNFVELIEKGHLPLRPGIKRLMKEANETGVTIGICTTSNINAAQAVIRNMLAGVKIDFLLAGDVVKRKKPDPEIYKLALAASGLNPGQCVVVEDSRNGLLAARAAGLRVIITTNDYTRDEDLSGADLIVTGLGDAEGEKGQVIYSSREIAANGIFSLENIDEYFC